MKSILLILIYFCILTNAQPLYEPLDKKAKKKFMQSYEALKNANEKNNHEAFLIFAPGVLRSYESILLDPESQNLRIAYKEIQATYKLLLTKGKTDTLGKNFELALKENDYSKMLKAASDFLTTLKANGQDSIFCSVQKRIDSLILKATRSLDFSIFIVVEQYPFASQALLDTIKYKLEIAKKDVLTTLSANLEYDEISNFQAQYPNLFSSDVSALKEMALTNKKSSALKKAQLGDPQALIEYRDLTGNTKDKAVEKTLEYALFKSFEVNQTEETASKYLLYYPESTRSIKIKEYLKALKFQQEYEHLAKQVLLRRYEVKSDTAKSF